MVTKQKNSSRKRTVSPLSGIIAVLSLVAVVFLCPPKLKPMAYRPYNPVHLSNGLKNEIAASVEGMTDIQVVKYSKNKTRELLTFSPEQEPFDDSRVTKAHCVGYAQVLATILNYAFNRERMPNSARPVVGQVYWMGYNLHNLSEYLPLRLRNFTKDHDFVEVQGRDKKVYVDASLNLIEIHRTNLK